MCHSDKMILSSSSYEGSESPGPQTEHKQHNKGYTSVKATRATYE